MEEPHIDENRGLSEKKPKRIVKTRQQVEALENFYNEHKYPNEALKLELAESIGLTEKQVSGWFCHRRLKDKKSPNDEIQTHGKQDRSSGVIQDRGSGLRQDSCGSTKQADNNKHFDPKEVESRRFTTENLLPTQIRFDQSQHNNNIMNMNHDDDDDDTSSGSSSPLKDNFHPLNVDHLAASKYPTHNDVKSVTGRTGPSGYLKVRGQAENAAITAVKRQLGRNYREDGPPLGIEFESLPPGAFESPVNIPVNQSYYVGDHTALDGSKTFQIPNANKMHERYNPKSYSHPIDLDESGLEIRHASKRSNNHHYTYKQTLPFSNKHKHSLSGRHLQMEMKDDDSGGENEIEDHFETRIRRPDSVSNRHLINTDENYNYPRGPHKVKYRDRAHPFTSEFNVKRGEIAEFQDRGISRKTPKDELLNGERRGIDEYSKLISVKIQQGNDMRIAKRNREDFSHQVYPRKEAAIDVPPRTNMTKRSSLQMTCSFSDDETASSGD